MSQAKEVIHKLLAGSGITINGDAAWDIQVKNDDFYKRVIAHGSLGLGEAYMDGWWECRQIDELMDKLLRAKIDEKIGNNKALLVQLILAKLTNRQSKSRAYKVGERHYDIGNELYRAMLDKRMVYTGGYWKNANNLDEAQEAKLELVCAKLKLQSGQKILDIGCGWGSFAKFAAQKYGVEVVGITVSKEQVELGNKLCKGLPVQILLQDYREVNGSFDHIISLGMIEHVGYKNYRKYMEVVHRNLKDGGLFLLQSIGDTKSVTTTDPWIEKYIFPNGMLPSISQLGKATAELLVLEDWHEFGLYYDRTLMAWYSNFQEEWPRLASKYNEKFYRMWKYYLLSFAGMFRSRNIQLWQIVFSKGDLKDVFQTVR